MTKKALRQLMENMERCGYKAHLASESPLFLGVEKDGETVGTIGDNGVRVYDDFLEEKARLQNLLSYSETFENHAENSHGHRELASLSGYTLAAGLDTGDGTPTYYIYPSDANEMQVRNVTGYKDLSAAKKVFAADAQLADSPLSTDYRQVYQGNMYDLLEKNGYEIRASAAGNVFDIARKGQVVGALDENLNMQHTGNDKVKTNLDSLAQQARWETDNDMYGDTVFTKRLSDTLMRLGYNVRHALQGLSLFFTVHKDSRELGEIHATTSRPAFINNNASVGEAEQLSKMAEKVKAEMRAEFAQQLRQLGKLDKTAMQHLAYPLTEALRRQYDAEHHVIPQQAAVQADRQAPPPTDESAPPLPSDEQAPPEEEDHGTGAVSCDITRTEAALMVALLGSKTGQKLAEKYKVRQLVDTLESKLRSPYPDIPAPGRTSQDMAENAQQAEQEGDELEQ